MSDEQTPVPPVPPAPPVPPVEGATPAAAPPPPAQPAYPAYGQVPTPGAYGPPTNTLSIVAMVLSLAGLITGITAIIGAILGHVSMGQIKRTGEGGRGFALTAIIVGWVLTGLGIIAIIAFIAFYAWIFTVAGTTGAFTG